MSDRSTSPAAAAPPLRAGAPASSPATTPHLVLAALGLLVAARLAHWLVAPPNSDEAYYWLWGLHPGLAYLDHPPLHAWVQGLFHAALGRSLLVLRLPAALTTAGTVLLLGRLAARLGGGPGARVATVAALLGSPLLAMLCAFAWNDHLLVFLVVLAGSLWVDFLAEVAAGERGSTARLLLGAAALGLAGLSKYSAVFLAAGIALAIVADRRLRPLLRDPRLWAAAALTLAVVSPVIAWNARHGLASFRFHLGGVHGAGLHLRPMAPLHFLVPTVLLLSPALVWAAVLAVRRPESLPFTGAFGRVYRRVALSAFGASTAFFLGLSLVAWSQYYWNVVAYLLLVPPAALVLAARPRLLAAHLGWGALGVTLMTLHGVALPLSAPFPFIRDDDSKEPFGWAEVAAAVSAERRAGRASFAAASDYRSGSHLAWALGDPEVAVLSSRPSQFDYWPAATEHAGETAVLVTDAWAPLTPVVTDRFERVTHLATVPVVRLGIRLKAYELWRAEGYRPPGAPAGR